MPLKVLLIIPVYNGARHLNTTFLKLEKLHIALSDDLTIVFVDDGSTDRSGETISEYKGPLKNSLHILKLGTNHGKGYAIREAVRKYGYGSDIVCFTDVDIPYGISAVQEVITHGIHTDIVTGSRELAREQRQYSGYRYIANRLFRLCIPREIREIRDTQCGLKAFKSGIAEDIFNSIHTFRWTFDIEIFVIAKLRGYTIKEIGVSIEETSIDRRGGITFLKDGLQILRDIQRIRHNIGCHVYEK